MSVYNIPAWSKDIDPLFTTDKSMLLSASDIYPARRMSDSALSADTGTTASVTNSGTSDPDSASPATEPDVLSPPPGLSPSLDPSIHPLDLGHHAHALDGDNPGRKPSLPGIGALPLLDMDDALAAGFPRRASLPTLTGDLSLSGGFQGRPSPRHSPLGFRPRTAVGAIGIAGYGGGEGTHLSAYAFPTPESEAAHAHHVRGGFPYGASPTSTFSTPTTSTTSTPGAFSPPFSTPLDGHGLAYAHTTGGPLGGITGWGTTTSPVPASSPRLGVPKRRRSPGSQSPAGTHPSTQGGKPSPNNPPQSSANPSANPSAVPNPADPPRRPRGKLPKHTTDLLKEWLHAHSDHPYPSEDEKRDLCARTKLSMSQVSNWMINARRRILAPAKPPSVSATTTEPYRLASGHHPHSLAAAHLGHHMAPHHLGHHLQPAHLQSSHLSPHHTHLQSSHLSAHHGIQSSHLSLGGPQSFAPTHTHHLQSSAYGSAAYSSHLQSGGLGGHHGGGLGMQSIHGPGGTRPISSLYSSHPHSLPLPLPLPAPHPHASLSAHPSSGLYASTAPSQGHLMRRVASEDSLRLYEPSSHASSQDYPRYSTSHSQSQGLYASERRLSYPTTGTVGGASPGEYNSSGLFLSSGTAQDGAGQGQGHEQGQGSSPASVGGDLHQQSVSPRQEGGQQRERDGF